MAVPAKKSIYPSIPAPGNDPDSMRATLDALRQAVTMVILNAQAPNANYAPSSATQVFVTKNDLNNAVKMIKATTQPATTTVVSQSARFDGLAASYADDAEAEAGGVDLYGIYRNGNKLCVRIV